MKILIGIPTYDRRVDIELLRALVNLERARKHEFDYLFPVSSHLSRNRNMVCHETLKGDYDALLFLDSDIGITDETFVDKLIETAYRFEAGIVGGAYLMKKSDEMAYVAGNKKAGRVENIKEIPIKPHEVEFVGTGIMLVMKKVLKLVDDPWFTIVDKPSLEVMPEDFEFCRKAKEKGVKIALDPRFSTNHYGAKAWTHL